MALNLDVAILGRYRDVVRHGAQVDLAFRRQAFGLIADGRAQLDVVDLLIRVPDIDRVYALLGRELACLRRLKYLERHQHLPRGTTREGRNGQGAFDVHRLGRVLPVRDFGYLERGTHW